MEPFPFGGRGTFFVFDAKPKDPRDKDASNKAKTRRITNITYLSVRLNPLVDGLHTGTGAVAESEDSLLDKVERSHGDLLFASEKV